MASPLTLALSTPSAARVASAARRPGVSRAPFVRKGLTVAPGRSSVITRANPFRFLEGLRENYQSTGSYSWGEDGTAEPGAKSATVAAGESLTAVADKYGMTAAALAAANGIANPNNVAEGTDLWIPDVYTIAPGDTLTKIAEQLGVSVADILACNNIANPDMIYADDVLVIPQK